MKLKIYEEILKDLKGATCFDKIKCVNSLKEKYPQFSEDTCISIYSQHMQRQVKKNFYKHHRAENVSKYYRIISRDMVEQSKNSGFILKLAENIDFPPALLSRIILEQYYKDKYETDTVPKDVISKYIKNPASIQNEVLSNEIEICIQNDNSYGPIIENIKREIGLKYEKVLHETLQSHNIEYHDEENLREEGYDKTPDFKLVVPIIVNHRIVNWIESKALFGDKNAHAGYLEKQFWSYTNRFGPGLVIYWFGFIDELNINIEQGVMLSDHFPLEFQTLTQLLDDHEKDFLLTFDP